jgi:hypothetical protein
MKRSIKLFGALACALLAVSSLVVVRMGAAGPPADTSARVTIKALSTDPSRVTGGDVLVEVALPPGTKAGSLKVTASGRDVTSAFHAGAAPGVMMGLVTGLTNGPNVIAARTNAKGTPDASLAVTNYPITGPVFSGPWTEPFICQTNVFKLPDGTTLGEPLDANCSANTVVQYVYRSTTAAAPAAPPALPADATTADAQAGRGAPAAGRGRGAVAPPFKPLPSGTTAANLPADLAKTTTVDGVTVNFIVRVETGTMDRGIYQNAILFDPTTDAAPTPFSPPKGWNHRLIGVHGSGCPGGWYIQGGAEGVSPLDVARLGQGYALFVNSLNHPTNSCNAIVAGEAAMMGKEHFIETFGVPFYTMSTGGSGGAYTSLQLADAFPGLFDGVSVSATFPDALAIAMSGTDAHLLTHYFHVTNPTGLTDAQKTAISGYQGIKAFEDAANQAQRTDPVPNRADIDGYRSAVWNAAVPENLRYDPVKNPKGARPTVFDVAHNVYGVNKSTGAALRPFDNVGVQYGLSALNAGLITAAQFLDLNEKIGGLDQDADYIAERSVGDAGAIKRAYESGLMLSGHGGLASIAVFDNATKNETAGYHYGWFDFALRDRLRQANGNSDNMVMWRNTTAPALQAVFDKWMVAYMSDKSAESQRAKMLKNKPAEAVEGCYDKATPPQFIAENLVFSSKPVSKCSEIFPVYSNPRHEAGGPLAANVLKCQLKPVDAREYEKAFTDVELARLRTIFPTGVCDFSKPGVNQTSVVTWASFGPSPKNQIFDVTKP